METDWKKKLKLLRVINENYDTKFAAFEGEIEENEGQKTTAVLVLEKTPFQFNDVKQLLTDDEQQFHLNFINDVYHTYNIEARSICNDVKLSMIYPATTLHINKYSKKEFCFVTETRHHYETIVRPYIEKKQLNPQWVYNIIDGKSEQDRIILRTDEFILLPTWTWDGKIIESMHILALLTSRDIYSIRDLKYEHIPLLESIRKQATEIIASKYGISSKNIRAFFHYPPSFYHLHLHFTTFQNNTCGCEVERAHLVENVIDHLRLQNDYYQNKTLYYKLDNNDPLCKLLQQDQTTNGDH